MLVCNWCDMGAAAGPRQSESERDFHLCGARTDLCSAASAEELFKTLFPWCTVESES